MPIKTHRQALTALEFDQRIRAIRSDRKVRPVVTPHGHRARGYFPSLKCPKARFESLVERDSMRIFEVARSVEKMETHPYKLELIDDRDQRRFLYTPDMRLTMKHTAMLVEVKGNWLLTKPEVVARLVRVLRALRQHEVPICLLAENDIRPLDLQKRLKELLRERPIGGRRHDRIDPSLWDPLSNAEPSAEVLRRWREAQKECDALLERVMRRDPDEVIESLQR
jgi:hypothetical protein